MPQIGYQTVPHVLTHVHCREVNNIYYNVSQKQSPVRLHKLPPYILVT
jgi:hypothetical protein